MRIDLKTARVRPVGSSGIAHRTNAGFVMLGTADSRKVLSIVEQNADQSNLVELVIAELSVAAPEAFCFLFMSQGELFVLTCGSAVISLTTSTGQTTIEPQPEQVLIQRIDLGVGDSDGRLVLFQRGMTVDQVDGLDSVVDLQSGTVLADALDLTIARASVASTTAEASAETAAPSAASTTTATAATTAAVASFALPDAADEPTMNEPVAVEAVAAETIVEPTPEPAAVPAAPETSASSMPSPPPPAADQIMFAEDIDEISEAVGEAAVPTPIPLSAPDIPAPVIEEPVIDIPAPLDVPVAMQAPDIEAAPSVMSIAAASGAATTAAAALPSVPPGLSSSPAAGAFSGVLSQTDEPAPLAVVDNGAVAVPRPATSVGPVMVLGVACPDRHHNHPDATECSECAARIGEAHTTVLMNGPRPPLGVLMVDDGKTWSLVSDIIIGREPITHADVAAGTASSMALTDDTLSLSRHHARISLDDWSAYVIDLGSSNGTYLNRNRSAQEWSPVPSDMALPLEPGDRLRVGGRIIQVELYQFSK